MVYVYIYGYTSVSESVSVSVSVSVSGYTSGSVWPMVYWSGPVKVGSSDRQGSGPITEETVLKKRR